MDTMSLDFLIPSHNPLFSSVLDGGVWQDVVARSFIHREVFTEYFCVWGFMLSGTDVAMETDKIPILGHILVLVCSPNPATFLGFLIYHLSFTRCCCVIPLQDFTSTYLSNQQSSDFPR